MMEGIVWRRGEGEKLGTGSSMGDGDQRDRREVQRVRRMNGKIQPGS